MKLTATFWICMGAAAMAGPYAPRAGMPGTTAIPHHDARIVAWAKGSLQPQYGTDVDEVWKTPAKALGPATTDVYDIVCLGNGGNITVFFPHPIMNRDGADFAVFENSFGHTFLELAFVEVSSDGVNFIRFPAFSDTPSAVGPFGTVDPTNVHGLAGKYQVGHGTPFDLSDLPDSPLLDKRSIRFVRIVDIIGDGSVKDSRGRSIYDPTPVVGSGGFDLEAVGVIHQNTGAFQVTRGEITGPDFLLEWESNPGSRYVIETSTTLTQGSWSTAGGKAGDVQGGRTSILVPLQGGPRRFWRVSRLAD